MPEDKIQEMTVVPVNERGEWVFEPGTGTSNVVGYLPSGFYPASTGSGRIPAVGVGGNFQFEYPVKLATWGDSLTDTSDVAVQDLTVATKAVFDGKVLRRDRLASALLFHSGGRVIPVANCGLGGTTSSGSVTSVINRDLNAADVNRRGAQDAANTGAEVCVISLGRNNILQGVTASTTAAAQQTILNTIYADVITAVKRAQALGMYPVLREFGGYGYEDSNVNYAKNSGLTPADVAVQQSVINRAAEHIIKNIIPTLGEMKVLSIREGMVDANGAWLPQYTTDGLHENYNGVRVIAKRLIALIASMTRPLPDMLFAPLPAGSGKTNGFANPAMLPPLTNGAIAGMNAYVDTTNGNSATVVGNGVVIDADGRSWQEFIVTPSGFVAGAKNLAPNGLSNANFYVRSAVGGATPVLPLAVGDVFRQEFDIIIDNGAGGPPPILCWGANAYLAYSSGQTFQHKPISYGTTNNDLVVPDEVIKGKVITLPIVSPAASADITNCYISILVYSGTTTPYRIRIGAPRTVKYNPL
jgi:lysophospholipase L1-like esterase